MCTGHSKQGLSDASDLKNPGEQAGGHRDGHRFNHVPPKATVPVGPRRGTPRRLLNLSGPVFSLANQVVMTKCIPSTQSWAPRKCLTPCSNPLHTHHRPPAGPCPSLALQAPSHPRTLVPFNPCRAARGVPTSASSHPGQELHLHRGPLLTDGHHSLKPSGQARPLRIPPLRVSPSPQDPAAFPFRGWATRKQARPGPQHFLWSCSQDRVISATHKGSQEAAFPPPVEGPVLAGPGRLGAQAPDSRGFFLPPPYPASAPSPFLAS